MSEFTKHTYTVPDDALGQRLDKVLPQLVEGQSRSTLQNWIKQGWVLVDDEQPTQKDKLFGGEEIEVMVPAMREAEWVAQDIAIDVVFEDATMLVLNKPAGLVVHPGAGNPDGTLAERLAVSLSRTSWLAASWYCASSRQRHVRSYGGRQN